MEMFLEKASQRVVDGLASEKGGGLGKRFFRLNSKGGSARIPESKC